jgi:hypothetical protein
MAKGDFEITPQRFEAARLLALDELGMDEIGEKVGVSRQTLWDWGKIPVFAELVDNLRAEEIARLKRIGISDRRNRVQAKDLRHRLLKQIVNERAAFTDGVVEQHPGWTTGLLVREQQFTPRGVNEKYHIDAALLREMSNLETEVAKELGQWTEKQATTHDATSQFVEALRQFASEEDVVEHPAPTED